MAEKTKKKTFEQGIARLDEIIALLEKDSVPLDELMKLYEEGVGLVRDCNGQLDSAEQKVKLLQISPDGTTARLVDFAEGEDSHG